MENVKKYRKLIQFATNSSTQKRVSLLKSFNHNIIKTICEIFLNILNKIIDTPPHITRELKRYKRILYLLVDTKVPLGKKKEALVRNKGRVLLHIKSIIP